MMYFVLMPAMSILRPEFRLPYGWLTSALSNLAPVLIFAAMGLVICALCRPHGMRKRALVASLYLLLLFLAVSAADYGLIYSIQVPAFARYVMIENRNWRTSVGESAPDFTVAKFDGTQVGLSDLRGKAVVLNFFATWCVPCKYELPHLQELWEDWGENDDFAMLVIGRDESPETVAAFQSERGYTFPMAVDPDGSTYRKFADEGIPRTYLVSHDGKILYQSIGFGEHPVYQRELATLRQLIDEEMKAAP